LEEKDTFKTIATESNEILFKEKNSKFYGYAFPLTNEVEVKISLEKLRKKHSSAGHFCYAFQTGTDTLYFRVNDDGEPSNSAGMPIYGQIQSYGLTNILVVVVRYFGGIKLGVGGLISSYKTAAQLALAETKIIEKTIDILFQISFDYKNMNKVMRIIKEKNLAIVSQNMNEYCQIVVSIRKRNAETIFETFKNIFEVDIKKL
jgi:uncharacterized YigZ family protein